MAVGHLLLLSASTASLLWWVPQLLRVWRKPSPGVSSATWVASATSLSLWGLWAALAGQPLVTAVEWIQAAGSVAVVAHIGVPRRALVAGSVVLAVGGLAVAWPAVAALAAIISVALVRLPQLLAVLRADGRQPPAPVSVLAWTMSAVSNLLWLAWSLVSRHPTMTAGATLAVLLSGAIVVATLHQRRAPAAPRMP